MISRNPSVDYFLVFLGMFRCQPLYSVFYIVLPYLFYYIHLCHYLYFILIFIPVTIHLQTYSVMARTRSHHQVDHSENSSPVPSSKRVRRSSSESKQGRDQEDQSDQASVVDKGEGASSSHHILSPTSLQIHLFTRAFNKTGAPVRSRDNSSGNREYTSHHCHLSGDNNEPKPSVNSDRPSPSSRYPNDIQRSSSPDVYNLPSSSPHAHPSGIEGSSFLDTFNPTPLSPGRVPSGIEGYYFPEYYSIQGHSSPPSPGSNSDLMGGSPHISPEQAVKSFENQYHFYDDPGAM